MRGPLFDTMLAFQLLTAGMKDIGFGLHDLAKDYLGEETSKENHDMTMLLKLKDVLTDKLNKSNLLEVAKLEFDCILAVVQMELNGMFLDTAHISHPN